MISERDDLLDASSGSGGKQVPIPLPDILPPLHHPPSAYTSPWTSNGDMGYPQSVQLSSKIREQLRTVQETHKKMQTQLHQEEKDLAKGKVRYPTLAFHISAKLRSPELATPPQTQSTQ